MDGTRSASGTPDGAQSVGIASALSNRELAAQITELSGHLNTSNHRLLVLIAEFDRRSGWADGGVTPSCAHWLHWQCGIGLGAAREKLRVAHALESLQRISEAMSRGELSYAKVRAVTRVADASNEEVWLDVARDNTAHRVEKLVTQYREALEVAELTREARQQASRTVRCHWDRDGSLVIRARLPAETGALVLKALDCVVEEMPPTGSLTPQTGEEMPAGGGAAVRPDGADVPAGTSSNPATPTWSMRRADALVVIAESFLAHGAEALVSGDRQQIIVHVDAATLATDAPGRCELEEGPSIAAETARRLACDASLVTIVEDERGEPLNVGRRTRAIPPAIRRALAARDKGCRVPGCTHSRFVDGHHVRHWAEGGETKLSNLVTLCRFHHRAVHEGRLGVERLDDGAWRFTTHDGETLTDVLPGFTRPLEGSPGSSRPWSRP
jgi:hypothetical protein